MSLELFVASAKSVPNAETFGKSDPYVTAEFQGASKKTDYKKSDLDPVFNQHNYSLSSVVEKNPARMPAGDDCSVFLCRIVKRSPLGFLCRDIRMSLGFDLRQTALNINDELKVYVKDYERVGRNRLLCQSTIKLKTVINGDKTQKLTLSMVDGNNRPTTCTLNVTLSYKPPSSAKDIGARTIQDDSGDSYAEGKDIIT
ncbi:hypothetical protein CAPTEDRAFT_189980 [Capitella teleta]|uniref:C2 domain-containing protein n=1 Tax=Capitella teleta TaxID=283909 RepID=R7U3M7_CAPTE|nr:hypothetical protein CAPTEDRAFT_189980 [Capitella teleta]|eukprot:ELT98271.1 hypothetical protein CAPTEDRAFT_189980 [Capitella teleta]